MTPAASGSAPSQSPSQAEAASGPKGEALLARIGNTPLLPLDAVTRDLPNVELLGKVEWYNPDPADPSKIAPPPALWPKHAAPANSLPERFCSIPPAVTPASPTLSVPLSDSPSLSACRRMFLPSENEFYRHMAQVSSTPTPPKAHHGSSSPRSHGDTEKTFF